MNAKTFQYSARDHMALDKAGNYYCRHVEAMTAEGLHAKSVIAAELAWRDQRIDSLAAELAHSAKIESALIREKSVALSRVESERTALAARLAEAERDATRYRFLRAQRPAAMHEEGWQVRRHWREPARRYAGQPTPGLDSMCLSHGSLDAQIDAAIASATSNVKVAP